MSGETRPLPTGPLTVQGCLLVDATDTTFLLISAYNGVDCGEAAAELARRWNACEALTARVAELEQTITDAVFNRMRPTHYPLPDEEYEEAVQDARVSDGFLVREAEAIRARWAIEADAFEDQSDEDAQPPALDPYPDDEPRLLTMGGGQ